MQLGMIGLGRMGNNMAQRLMKHGHECVVHDTRAESMTDLEGREPRGQPRWRSLFPCWRGHARSG